jgi:hypothetical protein
MVALRIRWGVFFFVATLAVAAASFYAASRIYHKNEHRVLADVQATLAFGYYKDCERIESMLQGKCYEAALTEVRDQKSLQRWLVSENLRDSRNDPGLIHYIELRDPDMLATLSSAQMPQARRVATCP